MADLKIQPGLEFKSLPLEFIIAAPLTGVIKAQAIAAETTKEFVLKFKDTNIDFKYSVDKGGGDKTEVTVSVPMIALIPVPHIRIDSYTSTFKYEISEVVSEVNSLDRGASLEGGTTGLLSNFVKATLKGSVSSKSSSESTTNRSGSLEITVHASEAPVPEGLARILSLLSRSIPMPVIDPPPAPVPAPAPVVTG